MNMCRQVGKRALNLTMCLSAQLPVEIRRHVAACPRCCRALVVARITRGLLAVLAEAPEPSPQFADRLLEALPHRRPPTPEPGLWHPAWGLLPAFAAMTLGLFLFYQTNQTSTILDVCPVDELSTSEQLIFGTVAPRPEFVLAAVLEGDTP